MAMPNQTGNRSTLGPVPGLSGIGRRLVYAAVSLSSSLLFSSWPELPLPSPSRVPLAALERPLCWRAGELGGRHVACAKCRSATRRARYRTCARTRWGEREGPGNRCPGDYQGGLNRGSLRMSMIGLTLTAFVRTFNPLLRIRFKGN